MIVRGRAQREERGAILVLSAAGMVIALIASALAIDIGRLAQSARDDQKVADMAALDAVRGVPADYQALADASALRNGFPTGAGYSVLAVEGVKVNGACQSTPGAGSACVTVTSPHKNQFPFVGGRNSITRAGMASNTAFGGFMIGSSLATFDTNRSRILDAMMGGMLKGSNINAGLVSWSGLAGANVTLEALRTQLVSAGISAGNVNALMNSNVTLHQLMTATASALTAQGVAGAAQATILNTLRAQITSTALTSFKLGDFMTVASGADNMALGSSLNVFQLVTAAAQVANGSNFIDVSNVGITVPNVSSTRVRLQVIEPPRFYFGPVGGSVSTAQVNLTVTPTLNLNLNLVVASVKVTSEYPVRITGGGAVGTLTSATCGGTPGISVDVDPSAFSGTAATTLSAVVSTILGPVATVGVPETSVVVGPDGGASNPDLFFSHPTEFLPAPTATSKHWGSSPIGLSGLTTITGGSPYIIAGNLPIGLGLGTVGNAVISALQPVVGDLDTLVITPLVKALGVDIGSADVTATALQCNTPTLSG